MKRRNLPTIILIILLAALVFSSCQRMEKSVVKDEDENFMTEENHEDISDKEPDSLISGLFKNEYLVPVANGEGFELLFGFADSKGNVVIEPQFKNVEPFYDCGVAIVTTMDDYVGLIDKKGNYLADPIYTYINHSEGLFIAFDIDGYTTSVFDEKGNKIFESGDYIYEFSEGLAPLYGPNGNGYIDKTGNLVLPVEYGTLDHFANGIAKVSWEYGGPSFYIDKEGNDLTDTVSSGLTMYKEYYTGHFGFVSNDDVAVIPAQFAEAEPFLNGYAVVGVEVDTGDTFGIGYGVIDTKGRFVINPIYSGIKRMKNGVFVVGEEFDSREFVPAESIYEYGKKAIFSPDGKQLTGWNYDIVKDFDDKYICVSNENSVAFYDSNFNKAKELPEFEGCGYFEKDGNLLRGELNCTKVVANLKGELLTGSGKDVLLGDGITAKMEVYYPAFTSSFVYPVITCIEDKALESQINKLIEDELTGDFRQFDKYAFETIVIDTDYSITRKKDLLIIDYRTHEYVFGSAHGSSFRDIVYIDLKNGTTYESIAELIKPEMLDDALLALSTAVSHQIREEFDMYWEDYVEITPEANFVLKEDGIIIYFDEYEIAAYAAGMPEFFIPYTHIREYIDTESNFWKVFN